MSGDLRHQAMIAMEDMVVSRSKGVQELTAASAMNEPVTDRELLELASRAAEIELSQWEWKRGELLSQDGYYKDGVRWNPLTDDGDALRLAVEIGTLEISVSEYGTTVRRPKGQWQGCEAHLHSGKLAATRRAITRAAAEIRRCLATNADSEKP